MHIHYESVKLFATLHDVGAKMGKEHGQLAARSSPQQRPLSHIFPSRRLARRLGGASTVRFIRATGLELAPHRPSAPLYL